MRNRSRRSFAVEVRSAGRGQAIVIPSRIATPTPKGPRLFRDPLAEPAPPPAEARRILPNLIVAEPPEPEPAPAAEDRPRRRGRPHKAPDAVIEPVAVQPVAAQPAIVAAPATPVRSIGLAPAPTAARRTARPDAVLAPGERWKRRLGRWSR